MRKIIIIFILILFLLISCNQSEKKDKTSLQNIQKSSEIISLPKINYQGKPIFDVLKSRRTQRNMDPDKSISLNELSTLLFGGDGITSTDGKRTAPSAMALYPISIYIYANNIENLEKGFYKYNPEKNQLEVIKKGDFLKDLVNTSQPLLGKAPVSFIMTCNWNITKKFNEKAKSFVYAEAGHISQNILLVATSLELKSVPVGGFNDENLSKLLNLDGKEETAIYVNCVGK